MPPDHIYLIGAEQVQSAANRIKEAAADMQGAIANLEDVLFRYSQRMDDWLIRLEEIMKPEQLPKPDEFGRKGFEVWSEGYVATGERSGAQFHGTFFVETFREAVEKWKATLDPDSATLVNLDELTFWGCRLFDNQEAAIKSFG